MTNKEKFLNLVSKEESKTLEKIRDRKKNRAMLRESQDIALKILQRLDELKWTQVKLAEKMGVKPQQVNKLVRGKENLKLETQTKIQEILDIPILASYYEKKFKEIEEVIFSVNEKIAYPKVKNDITPSYKTTGKVVKMENIPTAENSPYQYAI